MNEATRRRLMAFYDGECGRLESVWWRWRVARSPDFAQEIKALADLSKAVQETTDHIQESQDSLWPEISLGLASVDAARVGRRSDGEGSLVDGLAWHRLWRPAGAAVAALAVVGLWLALSGTMSLAPMTEPAAGGSLRYLDTHGRPVLVFDDAEDVTIIWLMNTAAPEGT